MRTGPSVIERMGAYQRATGLKPVGVHRPSADKLLKGVSHGCVQCGGEGYFEVRSAWLWCEVCGGLGRVMKGTSDSLPQGRDRVRVFSADAKRGRSGCRSTTDERQSPERKSPGP